MCLTPHVPSRHSGSVNPLCHALCSFAAVVHWCAADVLAVVAVTIWLLLTVYIFIYLYVYLFMYVNSSSFAFSALTLLVGWREGHPACKKTEWWGTGVVICLERDADLHMAQLMPLSLDSVKSRLVLPFWYRLNWVVLDKGPLNGCVCVYVNSSKQSAVSLKPSWVCCEVSVVG